jgi:uncharacterized protein YjbI with pentapeptide repeats
MKLAEVEDWIEEAQSVDVPLLVSSVEWEHTKLVDHVNIPLGANFVIGCEESDIIKSVWEETEVKEFTRTKSVGGLGQRVVVERETHIKVLGTTIRSSHNRPLRVKNLDDGSQYLLVLPHELTLADVDPIFKGLSVEEQARLAKFKLGLNSNLSHLELDDCTVPFSLKGANLTNCTFRNVDFTGSCLDRANLMCSTFIGCTLKGLSIRGANFTDCKLEDVDFTGSDLSRSSFYDADLHAPIMRGCNLTGVLLEKADFTGGDFTESTCEGVNFTVMDYSFSESESDCMNGYLQDPRLIFNRANLRDAKFDKLILTHAQFEGADLTDASFKDCDLSSSPEDYFYQSEGTSFKGALLEGVVLEGANLEGVLGL